MWVGLIWLLACEDPLALGRVEPTDVRPGDEVVVVGEGLDEGTRVVLGDALELEGVVLEGAGRLRGRVPPALPEGSWDVEVRRGRSRATLPGALRVAWPRDDAPCSGDFRSVTVLSLTRGRVILDRFYEDERRDRLEVPVEIIERVEVERHALGGCSAIVLRLRGGARLLFDDDDQVDLEGRGRRLASDMGRPVEVVGVP